MSLKIYAFPLSPRSFKVLWAANHVGVPFELKLVDFSKNAQNDSAFLALNPNGRAPAIDDDGYALWESNAILEYLASRNPALGLLPGQPGARADAGTRRRAAPDGIRAGSEAGLKRGRIRCLR